MRGFRANLVGRGWGEWKGAWSGRGCLASRGAGWYLEENGAQTGCWNSLTEALHTLWPGRRSRDRAPWAVGWVGYEEAARLSVERWPSTPPMIGHKTLARLPWDLARDKAMGRGADDSLLVDGMGRVLETSIANVWIVRGLKLWTPPAPAHCLPGVMRGWILERAAGIGLDAFETGCTETNLREADEVWVSNAVAGVRRVCRVEDRVWKRWPIFDRLESLGVPAPGWRPFPETQSPDSR